MVKTIIWIPQEGPPQNIKSLSDDHLINLIAYLKRHGLTATQRVIELEAKRRANKQEDYPEYILKGLKTGRGVETTRLYVIESDNQSFNAKPDLSSNRSGLAYDSKTDEFTIDLNQIESSAEYLMRRK